MLGSKTIHKYHACQDRGTSASVSTIYNTCSAVLLEHKHSIVKDQRRVKIYGELTFSLQSNIGNERFYFQDGSKD